MARVAVIVAIGTNGINDGNGNANANRNCDSDGDGNGNGNGNDSARGQNVKPHDVYQPNPQHS